VLDDCGEGREGARAGGDEVEAGVDAAQAVVRPLGGRGVGLDRDVGGVGGATGQAGAAALVVVDGVEDARERVDLPVNVDVGPEDVEAEPKNPQHLRICVCSCYNANSAQASD
jgi:hypothetical protein